MGLQFGPVPTLLLHKPQTLIISLKQGHCVRTIKSKKSGGHLKTISNCIYREMEEKSVPNCLTLLQKSHQEIILEKNWERIGTLQKKTNCLDSTHINTYTHTQLKHLFNSTLSFKVKVHLCYCNLPSLW